MDGHNAIVSAISNQQFVLLLDTQVYEDFHVGLQKKTKKQKTPNNAVPSLALIALTVLYQNWEKAEFWFQFFHDLKSGFILELKHAKCPEILCKPRFITQSAQKSSPHYTSRFH